MLKTFDLFEVCKLCFNSSCSLNNILRANGHEAKSGTGVLAIEWARRGEWDKVESYCMQDAIKTHQICSAAADAAVTIPLTGWSHGVVCTRKSSLHGAGGEDACSSAISFL